MVNHFATLLANLDLLQYSVAFENYKLADNLNDKILSYSGNTISLSDMYADVSPRLTFSPFTCRDFHKISLPRELNVIYEMLFPQDTSEYYKQFLLYCYLRLISSTDRSEDIKNYDKRLSYDLDDLSGYFNLFQTQVTSDDNPFKLLLHGEIKDTHSTQSNVNNFVIQQVANTFNVSIFSKTEKLYYTYNGSSPYIGSEGVTLQIPAGSNVSNTIVLGNTGLSFNLTGPFESSFTSTAYKKWTFTAATNLKFDFSSVFSDLSNSYLAVENMFNFSKSFCDVSYENMWNMHHNDVYKLVGLLLAYVERVNIVWQQKLTLK
jgi:hypothetical protein